MDIFRKAKDIMRKSGNVHQWNDGYPSETIVREDIRAGHCYVLTDSEEHENEGRIIATMAFIPGPDPTYSEIYDGMWPNDEPYYVIRISRKSMCLSIDLCKSEQKVFNI